MASEQSQFAIETFGLTKVFSDWWGRSRVVAVEDLNLKVKKNEVFGLLGPNGSGKTTIIKMLLNLLHPTKGKALVMGGLSSNPKISAKVGFLPEESYLYPYLNARETLDFYGRLFGLNSKIRKSRIDALLDMVGLSAMANRPIGTFSKGMARRIGLAQALINDPELLILDEPTSGLDPIGTKQIKDLIVELAKRGKTVLLCSHLLADAEEVCDQIAIMYGGRVHSQGSVGELLKQSDKRQITTDLISDEVVEKIKAVIESKGGNFSITEPMQKLESFFIDIVSKAQKDIRGTSGAVNQIRMTKEDASAAMAGVLDKLVSADVKPQKPAAEPTERIDTIEIKPDENVLNKLTEEDTASSQLTEAVEKTAASEPVETIQKEIKKDILNELVSGQQSADTEIIDKDTDRKLQDDQNG